MWDILDLIFAIILTKFCLFEPKVKAYDADTPPYNDQVTYFLKEGDTDLFRINASTGDISLLRSLDRELMPEYTLTLVAMDTGESLHYLLNTRSLTHERKLHCNDAVTLTDSLPG